MHVVLVDLCNEFSSYTPVLAVYMMDFNMIKHDFFLTILSYTCISIYVHLYKRCLGYTIHNLRINFFLFELQLYLLIQLNKGFLTEVSYPKWVSFLY